MLKLDKRRTFGALKCAIKAVLSILTKIATDGVAAPAAPIVPNFGRNEIGLSVPNPPVAL